MVGRKMINGTHKHGITTRTQKIWLGDDGIVRYESHPGSEESLEDAQENVKAGASLSGGMKRPILINSRGIKSLRREARMYYAGEENAKHTIAAAIVISSPVARVIANFFMGLNKTKFPTRLFTSEEMAIAWLKEFLA